MNALHDYVAAQLSEKIKKKSVIVWYDPRGEFSGFITELGVSDREPLPEITSSGQRYKVATYKGSFFEIRAQVEPLISGDSPQPVLIYIPGESRDAGGSILMEIEKAGETYEPQLKRLARNVLRRRFTDGVIDEILAAESVTYKDVVKAMSMGTKGEPPSLLKLVFSEARDSEHLLALWLVNEATDDEIRAKNAALELSKLLVSRLGMDHEEGTDLSKLRGAVLRFIMGAEFRSDLLCDPPSQIDFLRALTADAESNAKSLASRLRLDFPDHYAPLADGTQRDLRLSADAIPAESLGSIDTFRFEEKALLAHVGVIIASGKNAEALEIIEAREHSFWLDRDVARKAQWEAARRMAQLGHLIEEVSPLVAGTTGTPEAWLKAYTAQGGWHEVDAAQRRLEAWLPTLDEDPDDRPLGVVRRAYEDLSHKMALGFAKALVESNWNLGEGIQTKVFSDAVSKRSRPVAYFVVDAMRYEMGAELASRLTTTAEVQLSHATAALPSITPVGMGALLPEASSAFSVVEEKGRIGALVDGVFLPDLAARKKFAASRVPGLVDLTLDELLGLSSKALTQRIGKSEVVVVRSQEIDLAGETGFPFQARQVMDTVIDNLARAVRKLGGAGVEQSVISADHGHLFFASDREESMRADSPGGDQVLLHRRCWVGRGGATPPGCVRVSASSLGYASDLDFVFPPGCGVFRSGGDLAFHHGGPSLQELVIPILTIRSPLSSKETKKTDEPILVSGLPEEITNRIFSVSIAIGHENLSLFSDQLKVRPILISEGKQVGTVGMAIEADFDNVTGTVLLEAGRDINIALVLADEEVETVRVVVQDPATDAELYRSPVDIPVRLGI